MKARLARARSALGDFLERRCQWIDGENRCRCDRYLQRSLERGLITSEPGERVEPRDVVPLTRELDLIRRVTILYGSLSAPRTPPSLVKRLTEGLARGDWKLLETSR
ncbi:MAG: hypothetical protein QM765_36965 [Myxococcales bacterium]